MTSLVQSNQVVYDEALVELNAASRDSLLTILPSINTSLMVPGKLTASGLVVTIGTTSVNYPDARKKGFPLVDGKDVSGLFGTYNIDTGAQTDDVAIVAPPSMTNNYYIRLGFEVRSDRKIYPVWGKEAADAIDASYPTFSSGVPLGVILLQYGTGVFNNIINADIVQYIGAGSGAGGDSSFKIRDITGSVATINAGFFQLSNGYTLVTGAGTDSTTTNIDIAIDLVDIVATPDDETTYYLYIDLWKLSDPIVLTDNGRKVINVSSASQFALLETTPDQAQLYRYVYVGFIRTADSGNAYTGANAFFGTSPSRVHMMLDEVTPVELFEATTTTNSTSLSVSHSLTGEPQLIAFFYYNGTTKESIDVSSVLIDKNASSLVINTNDFDFTDGKYLEIKAEYNNRYTKTAVMQTNQYTSSWFEDSLTTTVAHNLGSKDLIKGAVVLEWDVTAGKIRALDSLSLVEEWDDTNATLNWTSLSPSSTLKYQFILGNAPLAAGIPFYIGGFNKFVGFGPGSYATLSAANPVANDSVLVGKSYIVAASEIISANNVKVEFMPGVQVTVTDGDHGLSITGNDVHVIHPDYLLNQAATMTAGIAISGSDCFVEKAKVTLNNAGLTVTNGYHISAGNRNYINGCIVVTSGTVTKKVLVVGTDSDYSIRG